VPTAIVDVSQPWVSAAPTAVGMDPGALARAAAAAAAVPRFRSLLVARHGRLVLERYFGGADSTTRFDVRSVTKSVVATLTGLALAAGKLPTLEATVGRYLGPPDTLDAGGSAVTVRELLTMTSGYQWDETTGDDYNLWIVAPDHVQYLFDRAQTGPPGAFTYNSAAVHVLGVLLTRATAVSLPEFADEALFHQIGITSAVWEPLENGTVNGGSGLALTGRDLLRFGQLVLQDGRSGTRQVVPAAWVSAMTAPQFSWRESVGPQAGVTYGYLWWVADGPPVRAFFAWGFGGQFIYVAPTRDLVVVATTQWSGSSTDPTGDITTAALAVIVDDVVPAVRE
jgi:CubicO group peptidase (beta-lactamase class C family)